MTVNFNSNQDIITPEARQARSNSGGGASITSSEERTRQVVNKVRPLFDYTALVAHENRRDRNKAKAEPSPRNLSVGQRAYLKKLNAGKGVPYSWRY